jgi:hypothetical protein
MMLLGWHAVSVILTPPWTVTNQVKLGGRLVVSFAVRGRGERNRNVAKACILSVAAKKGQLTPKSAYITVGRCVY